MNTPVISRKNLNCWEISMIGKLNHVAIAVPDITESSKTYEVMFKAEVSEIIEFINLNLKRGITRYKDE